MDGSDCAAGGEGSSVHHCGDDHADNVQQTGPTRIVTSSAGIQSDEVNFHLGQEGSDLSVRLRPARAATPPSVGRERV